ncbi:MAG: hypothetical protein J6I64_01020, partial [Lachnospiraceae bacterium]|nr:hypothetical protein [Lachnospiraceae bacterium]
MQRRRSFKSIVCVILTLFMILGTGLEPLAGSGIQIALGAEKDFALSASELYQGTNVVPAEQASNETFMKRYVKSSGNVLSLNSRFAKVSEYTKDVKGAGDTLSLSKMYQSSSSKYWSAQYKWTPNATEIQYLNRSDIDFIYEGTLIPNKHDHWIGDDHWNDAYVTLRKGGWDLSSDYGWEDTGLIMGKSTQRNNRVTLDVKETMDVSIDSNNADKNYLTYTAKHLGGQTCGGPAVSGSVFYFVDTSYPRVTDIYLTTDAAGTTAMDTYTSFGGQSNKTAYVVLEFDQEIRLADNYAKKDAFTLALDAYYGADCGYTENSNYNLTATLIKMEGKKMTFQFEVPAKLPNGKNTNIYITGIKRNQEFNQEWELILYGKKSDDADVFQITGQKAQSRITDITGNSLNWNASVKTMGTYYFDNVAPTLKSINMTGAMITTESTKEPTSWEDNSTDRDATFAGVGDRLGFQVFFSEAVSYNSVSGMKAVLSIKDGSAPVELSVSHVSGSCVTFENVTITEGMTTAGQRIVITGFKTDKVVKDLAGNTIAMDLTSISLPPNQQIYLDVDAPLISTSKAATENVYVMDNETVGGECFSFPLVFKEDTSKASSPYYSMINDCPVYFSIHTPNDSIGFTWYVDNNPTSSLSGFVNS